jgi:hypothetical protein
MRTPNCIASTGRLKSLARSSGLARNSPTLSLVLLLVTLPVELRAQLSFVTNNGAITITGYTGPGGTVTVPAATNGLPVTRIGDQAFMSKSGLTGVIIPDSVINLGNYAFAYCPILTSASLGNKITTIGTYAFYNCFLLAGIAFPSSVIRIGDWSFNSCTSLTNLTIPGKVINIGDGAFYNCAHLAGVTIPGSVTNIGHNAFYSCTNLTGVSVPNGVVNVGNYTFASCTSLTHITIPKSVTSIGGGAFDYDTSLATITVDPLNSFYRSADGVLFNRNQTLLIQYPAGKAGGYTVPESVTSIGDYAFMFAAGLTDVALGGSVTNVGDFSFHYCTSLAGVTLGGSVARIGSYAFHACASLGRIVLPNSVTNIGNNAFMNCSNLASITLGSRLALIGDGALSSCSNLVTVHFKGNAPGLGSSVFQNDSQATVYYLPETSGWETTFGGRPTVPWNPHIQTGDATFGVRTNRFGFTITATNTLVIVVEASSNLANPIWLPVGTNPIADGSSYFSDSQWTNQSARFYRLRPAP